ncbi:FAD-dependent oxidoreductase [Streptomyces sp. NPDC059788]|uniref:FAD-dependent oxidoreductase n=1 Tax=Streptomyces sp. NPDC059788 TaxID=3346948 RepID=UPI0036533941
MSPQAVVAGGSIAGLGTALALSGAGYRVHVLERGAPPPDGPPAEVSHLWPRPTAPQVVQAHTLTSLGVRTLRERAPKVLDALIATGARIFHLVDALPPGVEDRTGAVGDDELVALACRRTVLELVLHRFVRELPEVRISYGTKVAGLMTDAGGDRVRGVVTEDGSRLTADAVVDATGRRSESRAWLAAAGVPLADDVHAPSGVSAYTRFYRLRTRELPTPLNRGHAVGNIWGHYAGVLHPEDNDIFSVCVGALPGDRELSALREPETFDAVSRATPGLAPWLADGVGEPASPVHAITCPPNTLRGTASTRQRPVAGLFAVGDAACVTNPLFGRGVSLALTHAFQLADLLTEIPEPGTAQSRAAARAAERLYLPWFRHAAESDRARIAQWRAAVNGTPPPARPAATGQPGMADVVAAARTDGVVWRALERVLMGLSTPAEALGDEKIVLRVQQADASYRDTEEPPPSRAELLRVVRAAAGRGARR